MFTEKHYLEDLAPNQLDTYLSRGWYRMGQAVFTCRFLLFQDRLFPAVWIRLPLAGYHFRKSLRKLQKRNDRRFRTVVREAQLNPEKESLYQRYRRSFHGRIAPTLRSSLLDDADYNIFDTWEVNVYDRDQLVAFSFFDLGEKSLASILGVYDPNYASFSLGFYTMLEEIRFGLRTGMEHYYPGYVVPGYDKFDYKLRIGPVQFYSEPTDEWKALSELDAYNLPPARMQRRLEEVRKQLESKGIRSNLFLYPPYEANLIGYWILDYLEYPLLLHCHAHPQHPIRLVLAFDHLQEQYRLFFCSTYDDLTDFFASGKNKGSAQYPSEMELLIKEEVVAESPSAEEMVSIIVDQEKRLRPLFRSNS